MNWLFPGFLAGSALVGLPVLLHFLRRRPKAVSPFPSLRFLGETAIRDTRRHRLRRWLTLLLRCLIIGCLAAAFARPFWTSAAVAHRHAMVIALDNSMSMQARDRWENAREWALRQLGELRPGDQAALLQMHPSPTWLVPMTGDLAQIGSALRAARPGFAKTQYAPALKLAGDALEAVPAGKKSLVWMADEQRLGWMGTDLNQHLPGGVEWTFEPPAPAPAKQAAIVGLRRLAATAANPQPGLLATVRQFSPAQDHRRVEVRANGQTLAAQSANLQAGDNSVELRFTAPPGTAGVRVSMPSPDDLPADDAAWLALDTSSGSPVLLEPAQGTDFLAHALRSTQRLEEGALSPAPLPDGPWPVGAVAVVHGTAFRFPLRERLDRFVDGGGAAWIFVDGSKEQAEWLVKHGVQSTKRAGLPDGEAEHLRDWDLEHPALVAFAGQNLLPLLDLEFHEGCDLAGSALLPIASWPDGKTAIAEWDRGGQRILLMGFEPDRASTNWPAQPSFVPFVHQAARWLGAAGAARNDWHVGEAIALPPGEGTWRTLDSTVPEPERRASHTIRVASPGLYEFVVPGGIRKVFAVNPSPEESDLTPWPNVDQLAALEFRVTLTSSPAEPSRNIALTLSGESAENQQRFWWWVLAFCGACVLAELALANRTAM